MPIDPLTLGAGVALGGVNAVLGGMQASKQKKAAKKSNALDREILTRQRARALEELGIKEGLLERGNVREERGINEAMNDRGILDSSITQDNQDDRQFEFQHKKDAIQRARGDIDFEYQMAMKKKKVAEQLAEGNNWMNMLSQFINTGAMGVVQSGALGGR